MSEYNLGVFARITKVHFGGGQWFGFSLASPAIVPASASGSVTFTGFGGTLDMGSSSTPGHTFYRVPSTSSPHTILSSDLTNPLAASEGRTLEGFGLYTSNGVDAVNQCYLNPNGPLGGKFTAAMKIILTGPPGIAAACYGIIFNKDAISAGAAVQINDPVSTSAGQGISGPTTQTVVFTFDMGAGTVSAA